MEKRRATDMMNLDNLTDSQRLIILQNRVIENDSTLEKHHKLLVEGNGEIPLVEKVRNLENFANTIRFWFRTVAIAIVLQTITFGGAAIIYFVKLYPLLEKLNKITTP